jgi:ribosomal protein L40E
MGATEDLTAARVCRECRQAIPAGATRCFHCQRPQNWLRYVEPMSAGVAVVAAIFSGLAAAWGWASPRFPQGERLQISLRGVSPKRDSLVLIVSNTGDRPAAITDAVLEIPAELVAKFSTPSLRLELPINSVVTATQVVNVPLLAAGNLPRVARPLEMGHPFRVVLTIQDSQGKLTERFVTFEGID